MTNAREYTGWSGAVAPTDPPTLAVLVHGERLELAPRALDTWVAIVETRRGVPLTRYGIPRIGAAVKPALPKEDILLAYVFLRSFQNTVQHSDIESAP